MVFVCIGHIFDAVLSVLVVAICYFFISGASRIRHIRWRIRCCRPTFFERRLIGGYQRSNIGDNIDETTSTSCYAGYFILVIILFFMRGSGGDECNGSDNMLLNAALMYYG